MSGETVQNARGRWKDILMHFGMDASFLTGRPGPCPVCGGGRDRFRFDDMEGNGTSFCGQCTPQSRGGMQLLMAFKGWTDFEPAAREVDKFLPQAKVEQAAAVRSEESKRAFMKRLYTESRPVAPGDPVSLYLARRCGDVAQLLGDIRFHPALKHSTAGTTHPAMLSMMGWDGKRFSGIHRTYLTPDGFKAEVDPVRMNYGDAGPVRLGPAAEHMGIAEGIETAFCAHQLFGIPVWSGICADGVKNWQPPDGVKRVTIFADNDENFVGLAAAYEKARALHRLGYVVDVQIPPEVGQDWADVWAEAQKVQAA